jgi:hypothetical protein
VDPVVQQLRREQRDLIVEFAKVEKQVIGILQDLAKTVPALHTESRINRIVALRRELDQVGHGSAEYSAVLKRILAESRAVLRLGQ